MFSLTHLCRVDSFILTRWTGSFPYKGCPVSFILLPCFIVIAILNANSVDPDQTPRSAASDLGLHCLHMFLLWYTMHRWVNDGENITDKLWRCGDKLTTHLGIGK